MMYMAIPGNNPQLSGESKAILDRIEANCKLLHDGYHEKVDYFVEVATHPDTCKYHRKAFVPKPDCECPAVQERRVRQIKRPGLLAQLREFARNKDTDRNPKAERGAPRVKVAGRPPGDLGGFFALDEIECDIPVVIDRVLDEVGRDRTWTAERSVASSLAALHRLAAEFVGEYPDQARVLDTAAARWVRQARAALRISVGEAVFESVVCGNCGGGLSTPWGNRGEAEVACIGTVESAPCGHSYPVSEWIKLAGGLA